MSAALRIQLMLLARKNHFGRKSDLVDEMSLNSQHPISTVEIERTSASGPEEITSCESKIRL